MRGGKSLKRYVGGTGKKHRKSRVPPARGMLTAELDRSVEVEPAPVTDAEKSVDDQAQEAQDRQVMWDNMFDQAHAEAARQRAEQLRLEKEEAARLQKEAEATRLKKEEEAARRRAEAIGYQFRDGQPPSRTRQRAPALVAPGKWDLKEEIRQEKYRDRVRRAKEEVARKNREWAEELARAEEEGRLPMLPRGTLGKPNPSEMG